MAEVIVHKYVEPNFKKLKKNENADCTNCVLAEKTPLLEGGDG